MLHEKHEFSGHGSYNKTLESLAKYHWNGMSKDIKTLMDRCDLCAKFRPKFREPHTLKPSLKGQCPWECISIDLTGDMNTSDVN